MMVFWSEIQAQAKGMEIQENVHSALHTIQAQVKGIKI